MKRKLVKQGHNALTVTLPADWVRKFGLKGGDNIDLKEEGKKVEISVDETEEKKISFDMKGNSKYMYRFFGVLYRLGYDEVRINFQDPKIIDDLQIDINNMLGCEILDHGENYCVIRSVAGALEKEFDSTLKRIFTMLLSACDVSLEIIKKNELKRLESITHFERINNKLTNFCERLLNKFGYKKSDRTTFVYCIVWSLEHIADEYKNIWDYLIKKSAKNKKVITEEEIGYYSEVNELVKEYYRLFYNFDVSGVSIFKEKCLNYMNNSRKRAENKKGDMVILLSLHNIVERLYHMSENLIEI